MTTEEQFYSRQLKLIGSTGQAKLKNSKVLIIGAGGLGCPVILYLASMGIGEIGILDYDRVEISNLHRQIIFTVNDIGKFKAEVATLKAREQNPHIQINFFTEKFINENASQILDKYEIIVDCTDNFETKFLVHDLCWKKNKRLVQASIYQFEGNLHVFDFANEDIRINRPCLRCLWTKTPVDGVIGTCADVGIVGSTAGVLGSLQALEVTKIILGKKTLKNGEGLFVDLINHEFEKRKWKKNKDCSFCSISHNSMDKAKVLSTPQISLDRVGEDFIWIDIRSSDDVQDFLIDHPSLLSMPISNFNVSTLDPEKKYLLICLKGYRSNQLARALWEEGFNNFYSLIDGILNLKK